MPLAREGPITLEKAGKHIGDEVSQALALSISSLVSDDIIIEHPFEVGREADHDPYVARDGIALYEAEDNELHTPKPKTPEQALAMAKEYFEEWFPLATSAQKGFLFFLSQRELRDAAFILHQATERLYHCVLLVCTFYTPHVHNLAFLRTQAERLDRRLIYIWPRDNRRERALFEKLKEAYVKARYSKHYRITEEELGWLGARVEELGQVVHDVCSERIAELEKAASAKA